MLAAVRDGSDKGADGVQCCVSIMASHPASKVSTTPVLTVESLVKVVPRHYPCG